MTYKYSDEPDFWTAKAMMVYGGGFVSMVGQLWFKGDQRNRARVKSAFPDYFTQYQPQGLKMFEREYGEA